MAFVKPEKINKVPATLICTSSSVEDFTVGSTLYTRHALTFKAVDANGNAIDNFEMLTTEGMPLNDVGVHKYGAIVYEDSGNDYEDTLLIKCDNVIYKTESLHFSGIESGEEFALSVMSDDSDNPDDPDDPFG